jgi:hypothetical protein
LRPDQIDADIEALVHAAWLQAEDEVWRLEAYFRVRELAKRYPPADLCHSPWRGPNPADYRSLSFTRRSGGGVAAHQDVDIAAALLEVRIEDHLAGRPRGRLPLRQEGAETET